MYDVVGSDRPRRIRRQHGDLEKGIERDDEHPARHGNAEQIEHHPDRLWMADELAQVERAVAAMRPVRRRPKQIDRSEEHTSELQSLMRISYAVFCLKKKRQQKQYKLRKPPLTTQR